MKLLDYIADADLGVYRTTVEREPDRSPPGQSPMLASGFGFGAKNRLDSQILEVDEVSMPAESEMPLFSGDSRMLLTAERPRANRLIEIELADHHSVQNDPDPAAIGSNLLEIPFPRRGLIPPKGR